MDYCEAVALAKQGREEGYRFLYETTYKSKYYLALQYMKDEDAAQDVLQEAYMRAFSRLDMLEQPEAFSGWLGKIVGNTAKNMLQKKNPLLFSEMAEEEEDVPFLYEQEDESPEYQPELSYTRRETQELVHEMIDALSEEQRVCILMYEIEGISIREIAAALNCSENTVKSRLNYGRKNIKKRAEELQKKGYKLYGLAPLPLLLYLLRTDAECLAAEGMLEAGQGELATRLFSQPRNQTFKGNSFTVKKAFLHTAVGKLTVTAVSLAVVCAVTYVGVFHVYQEKKAAEREAAQIEKEVEETPVLSETVPESTPETSEEAPPEAVAETPTPTPEETEPQVRELTEEEYPSLIGNGVTREEMEHILAYGPQEIPEKGFSEKEYVQIINLLCEGGSNESGLIEYYGTNSQWEYMYSLEDINRMLSAFTTYQMSEENTKGAPNGAYVRGDKLVFIPSTMAHTASAQITSSEYEENEIRIFYTYYYKNFDRGEEYQKNKKATLHPGEDGKYRIVKIEEGEAGEKKEVQEPTETETKSKENTASVRDIYAGVLQSVQNGEEGYRFSVEGGNLTGEYSYFLCDMDGDGIQDLVVGAENNGGPFMCNNVRVYSCQQEGEGYSLKMIPGEVTVIVDVMLPSERHGFLVQSVSRGTGDISIYRISVENGSLTEGSVEKEYRLGDADYEAFCNNSVKLAWRSISDVSGLDALS